MPETNVASPSPGALLQAVDWMVALLSGQLATMVAVLAVALLGFRMFSGRVPARRFAQIVLGCFILFGAPTIARSIMGAAQRDAPTGPVTVYRADPAYAMPKTSVAPSANPFDPYANRPDMK
jgi:type IV secretory pathway VirB2 component (pilin)